MNKLHSFAFYALVTPAITLGAGSVMAEKSADQYGEREQQSTQRDQDAMQSGNEQGKQNQGYTDSASANRMQASNLIGAEVKTAADEDVGEVNDLIIDKNGQVAAIVVGVGGFLGMGEKSVAIAWDKVKTSDGSDDEQELRIDVTREELRAAQRFEKQD